MCRLGMIGAGFVLVLVGCRGLSNGSGAGAVPAANPQLNTNINHIIFMLQENRSFDHYFGQLNAYRAANGLPTDVDGLPSNASNPGVSRPIASFHLITQCVEDLSPSWNESHVDMNLNNPGGAPMNEIFIAKKAHDPHQCQLQCGRDTAFDVVWNPEFLREGTAVTDFL